MSYDLVVCGASITKDKAWSTWATFVKEHYHWNSVHDISNHGSGNELIVTHTIATASKLKNPFIAVMLTTFDKWDWVTDDLTKLARFDKEKNPICYLDTNLGAWGTGSHYPLDKAHYKEEYYCQDWMTIRNLQSINYLVLYCKANNIPFILLNDSPIFNTIEEYLNKGIVNNINLVNKKTKLYRELIYYTFYEPGLIGYAEEHNMPWRHGKFGTHPGSMVHWAFVNDVVIPGLAQYNLTEKKNFGNLHEQFITDQKVWDETNE